MEDYIAGQTVIDTVETVPDSIRTIIDATAVAHTMDIVMDLVSDIDDWLFDPMLKSIHDLAREVGAEQRSAIMQVARQGAE